MLSFIKSSTNIEKELTNLLPMLKRRLLSSYITLDPGQAVLALASPHPFPGARYLKGRHYNARFQVTSVKYPETEIGVSLAQIGCLYARSLNWSQ